MGAQTHAISLDVGDEEVNDRFDYGIEVSFNCIACLPNFMKINQSILNLFAVDTQIDTLVIS
jgi:hypothetical protein